MIKKLHNDQQGAVALLVLAALLAVFMLSLVIYDATFVARHKIEVQAAADSAAFSQSAVEARSMNMVVLANIGKRITVGMSVFYEALFAAWLILLGITIALLVIAVVACFFGVGCSAVEFLVKVLAEIALIIADEGEDIGDFLGPIGDYLEADLKSFDDYQKYMAELTPWWSWAEAWWRGARNGALTVGTFPVPQNITSAVSIPGIGSLGTGKEDSLPIEKDPSYEQLCKRSVNPDAFIHLADYAAKTLTCDGCLDDQVATNGTREVLYAAAGGIALGLYYGFCEDFANGFGEDGKPYHMKSYTTEAAWLLDSSNLVFSYRPGKDQMGEQREKYSYLPRDYADSGPIYAADGLFGLARSEISFQDGTASPDLWHAAYTARMRPVAFPGEWAGYPGEIRMVSAFHDVIPYMTATSLLGLIDDSMGTPDPQDLLRMEIAIDGLTNTTVDGVAK